MAIKQLRLLLLLILAQAFAWSAAAMDQPPDGEVKIKEFKFIPQEISVRAGDTIRWTNIEKRQYHSVWFQKAGDPEPGYIFPGETFQRTFEQTGSFPYRCGPHPEMTGTVHVK